MNSIGDFFAGLSNEASTVMMSLVLIGFLFGILIGYLLRSAAFSKLSQKADSLEMDLNQRQIDLDQAVRQRDEFKRSNAEMLEQLEKAKDERAKMAARFHPLEEELEKTRKELDEAKSAIQGYLSTIDDLHDQVLGLKTRNDRLAEEEEEEELEPLDVLEGVEEESGLSKAFAVLSAQLREVQRSNKQIAEELKDMRAPSSPLTEVAFAPGEKPKLEETPDVPKEVTPPEEVPLADPAASARADDLTRIEGIGPFLQQKLYDINITSYKQIAEFTSEDIQEVTRRIGYLPGRIEKDDWVSQARTLAEKAES